MKKFFIILLSLALFAVSAEAQYYVGGTLGIGVGTTSSNQVSLSWCIAPEFGYDFNEKIGAGVYTSFGTDTIWSDQIENVKTIQTGFSWSLAPYFRYKFGDFGKLSFLADAIVSLGSYTPSITQKDKITGSSIKQPGDTQFKWGISIAPGLKYQITSNWSLICHFASIGYSAIGKNGSFSLTANTGCTFGAYYSF